MLEGLRGEASIAEVCRREGINPNLDYRGSKDFLEGGKKRLQGDTGREANTDKVISLRQEIRYRTLRPRRVSYRKAMRLHTHRGIDKLASPDTIS